MKKFRLIDSFYLTVLLGLVLFTVHDMKKPDCLEAQTCVPIFSNLSVVTGAFGVNTSASCPGGTFVSGGGCGCEGTDAQVTDSRPAGNGWFCRCEDTESDNSRSSTPYAVCIGP